MTSYHGGKQRIGKKLAEIIVDESITIAEDIGFKIKGYCEPFCGMLGVYQHIPELFEDEGYDKLKYKASDINKSVIMMWKAAQKGWKPPISTTEKEYNKLKYSPDSALRGYIGHQYSFGGQFFNGYSTKYGKSGDSSKSSNSVYNIGQKLKHVSLKVCNYDKFSDLNGYVIYCDPPYEKTTSRYYHKLRFDHIEFWSWCRYMAKNNIIFVSSYKAPIGFKSIYSSSHKLTGIGVGVKKKRIEKLYILLNK